MESPLRHQIQRSLTSLTTVFAEMTRQFEETLRLLSASADLDPRAYFDQYPFPAKAVVVKCGVRLDPGDFTVSFRGQTCFLNNTHSFRLLKLLLENVNTLVSHQRILDSVWDCEPVGDHALRCAMKNLRRKLRNANLESLASAISGVVPGHYRLQLS